jgi:hypothetical protein
VSSCSHHHWDVKVQETATHITTWKKCVNCSHTWDRQRATKLKPKLPKRKPKNPK